MVASDVVVKGSRQVTWQKVLNFSLAPEKGSSHWHDTTMQQFHINEGVPILASDCAVLGKRAPALQGFSPAPITPGPSQGTEQKSTALPILEHCKLAFAVSCLVGWWQAYSLVPPSP